VTETLDFASRSSIFLNAMQSRFACKRFDTRQALDDDRITYILECARLSPSSFGLEHWQLYAVTDRCVLTQLFSACLEQEAVSTASLVVIAVTPLAPEWHPDSQLVRQRGSRFPGGLAVFIQDYQGYYDYLVSNSLLDHWARAQCYIPCANMMTGAAYCGIDSLAIEGFKNEEVLRILGLDAFRWQTAIITAFGYRDEPARPRIRESAERIITHV